MASYCINLFWIAWRWQSVVRLKRGEVPLSPHVYLQGWQLKSELSNKAKAYDNCTALLFVSIDFQFGLILMDLYNFRESAVFKRLLTPTIFRRRMSTANGCVIRTIKLTVRQSIQRNSVKCNRASSKNRDHRRLW